jgi:hypothetical protein
VNDPEALQKIQKSGTIASTNELSKLP